MPPSLPAGDKVYAYVYNDTTSKNNGTWPGVAMTQLTADDSCAKAGTYKYEVPDLGEGHVSRDLLQRLRLADPWRQPAWHRILRQGELGWFFRRGERGELQHSAAGSGRVGVDLW